MSAASAKARWRTLRALPALGRIGIAEAMAYRAELVVWILTTTMPLVMLPLWHAVAETGPVRGWGASHFTAYFLTAFVVRQMTAAWASWTLNYEVRTGALSMRLLRPIHPFWAYAIENLAALPLRLAVAMPVALAALYWTSAEHVVTDARALALPLAIAGAWSITFLAHLAVGTLSLWTHSSIRVMDAWTAGFFVMSGYLVPVALFPEIVRSWPTYLPFRYQLGFPVELATGSLDMDAVLAGLAIQWTYVGALAIACAALWRVGLRRFGAFGG